MLYNISRNTERSGHQFRCPLISEDSLAFYCRRCVVKSNHRSPKSVVVAMGMRRPWVGINR